MPGGVAPVAVGKIAVAVSAMPVPMRVMPVPVAVGTVRVTVMPVGALVNPMWMEVEPMGMPVVPVGVPGTVVRPRGRRGVGMGHREEGDERAEREPRDRIAAPVPVVVPPTRLGGAGDGEHGRESECGTSHRASSSAGHHRTPRSDGTARTPIASGSPALWTPPRSSQVPPSCSPEMKRIVNDFVAEQRRVAATGEPVSCSGEGGEAPAE